MTENNKPEWFEIAENDGPSAPPKASKALPLFALLASALILGVGAVVGLVQDKSPATAVNSSTVQATQANDTSPANNTASPTTVVQTSHSSPVARIANPAASTVVTATEGLQNPAIAQLPTKGGDDDDDGDDGDDDDDEDDEDEDDDEEDEEDDD
jgi:hypothetical protein